MERLAEVVLFHHVQGLTPGIVAFADELRAAGHTVHTPDLFDGRTFPTLEEGMALVIQPNVITTDERAGVQTGHLVVVTADGHRSLHDVPRGLIRIA